MADKEPRRRKKRKDSQRKDDMHSEDQIFMSTRSESKDSDQEVEEEIIVTAHQPSGFAKIVFVLLFSGLVLSMSFIFISLHGTERGSVDLFDDHHSEEHEPLHNLDQVENDSSIPDHSDGMEVHDSHEEEEKWSSSDFLSGNIMDMLPDIGEMLSFNNENTKEFRENTEFPDSEKLDTNSEDVTEKSSEGIEMNADHNEEIFDSDSTSESPDLSFSSEIPAEELDPLLYEEIELPMPETTDYSSPGHASTNDFEEDITPVPETTTKEIPERTSRASSEIIQETRTEEYPEEFSVPEDNLSPSTLEDYGDELTGITPDSLEYEEEDKLAYEKISITNEMDYEIREELDALDKKLDKSAENVLKRCNELLKLHKESPRLHFLKAQALDKIAESQRSNKLLEDAILGYQKVLDLKNVPEGLYLIAGKLTAEKMRFRGFMGKSVKLLSTMLTKYPQNIEVRNLLAVGYLLIGQNKAAKKEFQDILKVFPDSGFAKVHLGFILKTDESKYEESIKLLSEGIASRESGVLDGRFYFHLGDALHRIDRNNEALKVYDEAVKEGLFLSRYQRSLYNVNGLTGKPWWDPKSSSYAPYFKILERDWSLIRDEAVALMNENNSGFMAESEGLQDTGDWKQFELFARGRKIAKNCAKAPKTCSLISQMPDAANCKRGQAKFSIMHPSTHVWAHTGPTNCRLRAHLGLIIPDGASIRVADEIRHWEEGKIILFDDSFEHEVWHNGSSSRLVLIVDFWHPELTAYQKRSLSPI
ncbi:aspartyl/asparaginyl beta-hydroxylase isoform X2 [Parasteatoda tepidariorum]|uniref:aspartyl/asparaginyl beta-hydroxylase isoform X2 n=1 Tax=Parasteatoda tepidariorum TaxID=114398 RepID=UPI000A2C021B|nr:aspartyl/asparaginyl beta-hydroxylase isoform X2 [Parasteatoda tepidariorum]